MNLRLLLFSECNRSCKGCCNKDWDLDAIPIVSSYEGYECIMLTGGEPGLYPPIVGKTIISIREETDCDIYVYTAMSSVVPYFLSVANGVTLTLHNPLDVESFKELNKYLIRNMKQFKSLRLNVFKGVDISDMDLSLWKVQKDMVWVKDCPLPKNEVFMKL